jgi:hypothetical protein
MDPDIDNPLNKALLFLEKMEGAHIWYRLEHVRDSLMVITAIPGERWEIEFFADGSIEVERFISTGEIEDETVLEKIFQDGEPSDDLPSR